MATVGRGAEQYTVRFPDGLRDRIKAAADENNRSMNAEIVATLEEKYPAPKPPSSGDVEDLLLYVLSGGENMEARAMEANAILKERKTNLSILVLDKIRAGIFKKEAIIVIDD